MKKLIYILALFASIAAFAGCGKEKADPEPTVETLKVKKDTAEKEPEKLSDEKVFHRHNHDMIPDSMLADADSIEIDTLVDVADTLKQLRILSIGNSYARDAFSYVPFILNELLPDLDIQLSIMYIGGCPLEKHWNNYQSQRQDYERDTYTTAQGKWITERPKTLTQELDTLHTWDMIVFQQASGSSPSYATYQPYIRELISAARSNHAEAKIGWLLTPAHPDGYSKMPTATSDDMWQLICDAVGELLEDEDIDVMFPGGTAVQNARQTYLDTLGTFGHMSSDGLHLQDGLPCLIEAYTIAQQLIRFYHLPVNINNSNLRPTQQWAEASNTPQMHGSVIEGSDADYALCKSLALRAINYPFSLAKKAEAPEKGIINNDTIRNDSVQNDSVRNTRPNN